MGAKEVQLAVVGVGGWGTNVLRSFVGAAQCKVAYICDTNPHRLAQHQQRYPQTGATDNFQSILQDDELDAVAIVTPPALHYPMARDALVAGKHVFVEKPLALSAHDAQDLFQIARRQDRKLMVGHLLEYHPAVDLMKREIDRGELGQIYYMYCQRLNLGVVRQYENSFWSLAPHDISIILYLFGMEPDRVTASGACFLQDGIEDVVFATLHFPDGRVAQIHVSWLDPHKARTMVVVGARKMLVFDDMQPTEKVRIVDKGANLQLGARSAAGAISVRHGDIHIPHVSDRPPLDIETQHFVDCILDDATPRSDGQDGLRVVRVLEQVERQLRGSAAAGESAADSGGYKRHAA